MAADKEQEQADTARFLVERYNAMGCRGITLGERDLALDPTLLSELRESARFPFLVANLFDKATGKPAFDERVVHEIAGVKIGLFGLTTKRAMAAYAQAAGDPGARPWQLRDPVETARVQVAALKREGAEVIVVLAHLSDAELSALARAVPSITAILGGDGTSMQQRLRQVGQTFISGAFSKGKYMAELLMHIPEANAPGGPWVDRFAKGALELEIQRLAIRIKSYERVAAAKEKEELSGAPPKGPPPGATPRSLAQAGGARPRGPGAEFYRRRTAGLRAEKQVLELELEELDPPDPRANFVRFELVALGNDITEQPEIARRVADFRLKYPKARGH